MNYYPYRLSICATLILSIAFIVLTGSATAFGQTLSAADQQAWEQRLVSIAPNTVEGTRTIQTLLTLPPDESFALFKDAWQKIPSPETRLYLLNMAQEHPRVLDLLDIGAKDTSLFVQNRALQALEMYSFESYAEDFSAYNAWRQKQAGRTLEDTMRESCREYLQSVQKADEATQTQRLLLLQRIAYNLGASAHARDRRKAMLESGLPDALAVWVANPNTAWTAFAVLRNLKMDEAYLRKVVLPLATPNIDVNYRRQALGVLATPDNRWASKTLLDMFVKEYPDPEAENVGYALTQLGDASVLPTLIAIIEADNNQEGQRVLGNILSLMTGNNAGQMHDAVWWRAWWTRNAARFPSEIRALPIPKLAVRQRPLAPGTVLGPEQRQIGGDIKRTYWLIGPANFARGPQAHAGVIVPPAPPVAGAGARPTAGETPGLIVVLPPDGNGAASALFWQNLAQKALKNRYFIAVATAPKWTDPQSLTWITSDTLKQVKEAKFTTEKFAAEIAQDVMSNHPIDRGRVYLHGAADSGPAAYACALDETTPFKGFYILASTFKSSSLPPLARAKNRRLLIQHSSDDKTAPFIMAAAAQKILAEQGAVVKLESYKGAHGYVFSDSAADPIGDAIAWLDGSQK